jgi:hypothetical protein
MPPGYWPHGWDRELTEQNLRTSSMVQAEDTDRATFRPRSLPRCGPLPAQLPGDASRRATMPVRRSTLYDGDLGIPLPCLSSRSLGGMPQASTVHRRRGADPGKAYDPWDEQGQVTVHVSIRYRSLLDQAGPPTPRSDLFSYAPWRSPSQTGRPLASSCSQVILPARIALANRL